MSTVTAKRFVKCELAYCVWYCPVITDTGLSVLTRRL